MAHNAGYIGRAPGDSSPIIARQVYTPGGSTSEFTVDAGYDVGRDVKFALDVASSELYDNKENKYKRN